jgi:hypothetical protein
MREATEQQATAIGSDAKHDASAPKPSPVSVKSVPVPSPLVGAGEFDVRTRTFFDALDVGAKGHILRADLFGALERIGVQTDDVRLRESMALLKRRRDNDPINYEEFCQIVRPNIFPVRSSAPGHDGHSRIPELLR